MSTGDATWAAGRTELPQRAQNSAPGRVGFPQVGQDASSSGIIGSEYNQSRDEIQGLFVGHDPGIARWKVPIGDGT